VHVLAARLVDEATAKPAYVAGLDGLLLRSCRGGIDRPSTLSQMLQKARPLAFTPVQVASPLACQPYDLRHAGISWRLNSGVPGPKVAEWAGHSMRIFRKPPLRITWHTAAYRRSQRSYLRC
jgi:integrase